MTMIFPNGRSASDRGKYQEQESSDLQPKYVQHMAYASERDPTSPVNSTYPTILASFAAGNAQKCPALSTEIAGCHAFLPFLVRCCHGFAILRRFILSADFCKKDNCGGYLRPTIATPAAGPASK